LIEAVRQSGDLKMPPKDRLTNTQLEVLERWVALGAPWPAAPQGDRGGDAAKTHWAFQPVRRPEIPRIEGSAAGNPIDAFIRARLAESGLAPSAEADRRTLIRRVTYDLTGLPPSPVEVEAFVQDSSPEAYARLVERLLDSPHYGEHWGRHWLDVARYSDTKGYVYGREEKFYFHASTYRDWVVQAFNRDLPYDRFLLLQIAADQAEPNDVSALPAMGFLTLGRRFLGVTHDIIDDRIDVVTRGTMGLTVGCARCHDHKYDPIPTADYYSLYGVFQNCCEKTVEFAPSKSDTEAEQAFLKELDARRTKLHDATAAAITAHSARVRSRVADYLFAQRELQKYPEEGFDQIFSADDLLPDTVRRWETYLAPRMKLNDPVFRYWKLLGRLPEDGFADQAAAAVRELAEANEPVNGRVAREFASIPASAREVADRFGRLFQSVDEEWKRAVEEAGKAGGPLPRALADPDTEALRQVLYGADSPCVIVEESIASNENVFDTATRESLWRLQGDVDRWLLQAPEPLRHTLILADRELRTEPRIFKRGNPANKGEAISRHFLSLIAGPDSSPFQRGSGRLELAQAIIAPDNPLTARVWINRVWNHHFGSGLVRTPSDFGIRAEPPSHPELLDWLAGEFVRTGWSTKALHRLILLSATYRQSSTGPRDASQRDEALRIDPENRRLWRMNAHRLTFEEVRDTLLSVSGQLEDRIGGRPADLFAGGNLRRTLYGLIDRQFVPPVMRVFDFANPDLHIPQRAETTVPQQALFAMNHPFVATAARSLVKRPEVAGAVEPADRIRRMYQLTLQREPTSGQLQAAQAFIGAATQAAEPDQPSLAADWKYGYGSWNEAADRMQDFQPLPYFNGMAWQGGVNWPDGALGWVQLTAEGGHPGNDVQHAAIRRWTAPMRGTVAIESLAVHEVAAGDGIRCRIVSSRQGTLATAELHNGQRRFDLAAVEVEAGETLDFVVDINANLNSDQFLWSPRVRELSAAAAGTLRTWDAAKDFDGSKASKLSAWEQLAQVLLLSNELMFVD
jgi:hypothetical protein